MAPTKLWSIMLQGKLSIFKVGKLARSTYPHEGTTLASLGPTRSLSRVFSGQMLFDPYLLSTIASGQMDDCAFVVMSWDFKET